MVALFTHRSTPNQSPDPKLSIVSRKHTDIEPNDIVPLDAMYTCHQNIRGDQIYYVIMLVRKYRMTAWLGYIVHMCSPWGILSLDPAPVVLCVCVCVSL